MKLLSFIFREKHGWDAKSSLLMDGGNENSAINLRKVHLYYNLFFYIGMWRVKVQNWQQQMPPMPLVQIKNFKNRLGRLDSEKFQ